jgi:hypothetical protein
MLTADYLAGTTAATVHKVGGERRTNVMHASRKTGGPTANRKLPRQCGWDPKMKRILERFPLPAPHIVHRYGT